MLVIKNKDEDNRVEVELVALRNGDICIRYNRISVAWIKVSNGAIVRVDLGDTESQADLMGSGVAFNDGFLAVSRQHQSCLAHESA